MIEAKLPSGLEEEADTEAPAYVPPLRDNIIRRIVDISITENVSIDALRLTSQSWNKMVLDRIVRPYLGTIERVYLCCPLFVNVEMYAILPERCSDGVGVGKWLRLHERHDESAIEVKSSNPIVEPGSGLLNAIANLWRKIIGATPIVKPNFVRFIALFDRIDTLVLNGFSNHEEPKALAAIQGALGAVRINRLEVEEYDVSAEMQNQIISLCSDHAIHEVLVDTDMLDVKNFYNFAQKSAQLGVTLDIYVRGELPFFGEAEIFWDKMADELKAQGVSFRRRAVSGVPGASRWGEDNTIGHFRIATLNDANEQQPLQAVQKSRGYCRW